MKKEGEMLMKRHVLAVVLLSMPLLQSCSSVSTTLAFYGVKALMNVGDSSESAYGYYQLGKYRQERNQLDEANAAYERALSLDPHYVEAKNALGVVSCLQNKLDVAVEHFRSALSDAPRSAHVLNNLGHTYNLQGKYTEAISSLEAASALDARNYITLQNLGRAYQGAGRAQKAEEAFAKAAVLRTQNAYSERIVNGEIRTTRALARTSAADSVTDLAAKASASPIVELRLPKDVPVTATTDSMMTTIRSDEVRSSVVLIESNVYELRVTGPTLPPFSEPAGSMTVGGHLAGATKKLARLEISNGNAIPGLGRAVSDQLKRAGFNVMRLTNERPFRRQRTELQFRDGYTDVATSFVSRLPKSVNIIRSHTLSVDVDVRLVLGHDVLTAGGLLGTAYGERRDAAIIAHR